ncbi:MAG: hypothetical protein KGN97_08215 [Bacteroidota bacterium]|jgi:hypothetical protein|nr:hypothetical protein [Bacteroidota bacterium]
MPCILWIESPLSSAELLERTALKPCKVIEKGSIVDTQAGTRSYERTLIGLDVSLADFTEIKQQIDDALSFFETNQVQLEHMFSLDTIKARIDFGFYTTFVDQKIVVQHDSFPHQLLSYLGHFKIDLDLSQFWYGGNQDLASI